MPRWRRRRLFLLAGSGAVIAALVAVGLLVIYPRVGAAKVRAKVTEVVRERLGRHVQVGAVEVSLGHATLRDVVIPAVGAAGDGLPSEPLVQIARIDVDFGFFASLLGKIELGAVRVVGVEARATRLSDGRTTVDDIVAVLRAPGGAGPRRAGPRVRPTQLDVTGVRVRIVDDATGAVVSNEAGQARWTPQAGLRADLTSWTGQAPGRPTALLASAQIHRAPGAEPELVLAGGAIELWRDFALTGIGGTVRRDGDGLTLALAGGYGGVDEELWQAKGALQADGRGTLDINVDKFHLDKLAPVLQRTRLVDYQKTSIDGTFHAALEAHGTATFTGGFSLRDLTVGHPMLASKPVHGLEIVGEIAGDVELAARRISLRKGDFESRGLPFAVTGAYQAVGGRVGPENLARPKFEVRLQIPTVPCQQVLDAIPKEMAPYLQGYRMAGQFATDVRLGVDYADLDATVLDGSVGLRGCKVTAAPPESPRRLQGSFEHFVEVARDTWISFVVGPGNPDFVPLTEVSPHLPNSLMTTEDSAFMKHRGFIVREFRSALIKNLRAGYFRYGASSITMQLVKNVLLYREKTLARKLQELFLTWYIEQVLDKPRILEIYVNVIEYGPGLYGIGPAARHYFGKHPRDLNPVEAAFFSSILPAPKRRYKQYCDGTLTRWTSDKIARILELMHKRGRLTAEELAQAQVTPLTFVRDGSETEAECQKRADRAIRNARPTNPMAK